LSEVSTIRSRSAFVSTADGAYEPQPVIRAWRIPPAAGVPVEAGVLVTAAVLPVEGVLVTARSFIAAQPR
jgi:hypothetical protein